MRESVVGFVRVVAGVRSRLVFAKTPRREPVYWAAAGRRVF